MRWFIVGGAGFIGSHFVDKLLLNSEIVTLYDNLSSGRNWHYEYHKNNPKLSVVIENVENTKYLSHCMKGHDVVIHLASNPDIAKAAIQPDIDFWQGTVLTNSVLEAMRISGVKRLLYASGSGVYGDIGEEEAKEERGNLLPISTYGASKLSGEVLINSYCHMFDLTACAFRFGNVVGSRQTHGITFDFTKKLLQNSNELTILGNGTQSKSYIHVDDVIRAVLLANEKCKDLFQVFNVATGDYITVKEIAELAVETLNLSNIKFNYTGGNRGWKGDVPIVRLNTSKIKNIGWECYRTTKEALNQSIVSMVSDIKSKRM